jgi:hypothetical protein
MAIASKLGTYAMVPPAFGPSLNLSFQRQKVLLESAKRVVLFSKNINYCEKISVIVKKNLKVTN